MKLIPSIQCNAIFEKKCYFNEVDKKSTQWQSQDRSYVSSGASNQTKFSQPGFLLTANPVTSRIQKALNQARNQIPGSKKEKPWYTAISQQVSKKVARSVTTNEKFDVFRKNIHEDLYQTALSGKQKYSFLDQFMSSSSNLEFKGVALIASYLKQKYKLNNLYSCTSLQVFKDQLKNIQANPQDSKHAFIVSDSFIYEDSFTSDKNLTFDSVHKIAVCVEKKAGKIEIAILDSLGSVHTQAELSEILRNPSSSSNHVLERHIRDTLDKSNITLYSSSLQRQYAKNGCETFALNDAVSFLQNPRFFQQLHLGDAVYSCHSADGKIGHSLEEIIYLPPSCMKGTQSFKTLKNYMSDYYFQNDLTKSKVKDVIIRHQINDSGKIKNNYNTQRSCKYRLFVAAAMKTLSQDKIEQIIQGTFLQTSKANQAGHLAA